ncbi:MAG: hypothetical protein V3R45_03280 [Candidatus Aminicenantaceae bacterium]
MERKKGKFWRWWREFMVIAFGLKYIIIDASRTKDIKDSKYLGNTGILLYLIHTPPISKGEPLFEVGRIKK